jgi:hypothetical protein
MYYVILRPSSLIESLQKRRFLHASELGRMWKVCGRAYVEQLQRLSASPYSLHPTWLRALTRTRKRVAFGRWSTAPIVCFELLTCRRQQRKFKKLRTIAAAPLCPVCDVDHVVHEGPCAWQLSPIDNDNSKKTMGVSNKQKNIMNKHIANPGNILYINVDIVHCSPKTYTHQP